MTISRRLARESIHTNTRKISIQRPREKDEGERLRRDVVRDLPDHLPVVTRFDEELPRSLAAVRYSNHSDVEHDRSIELIETNGHDECVA